MIHRELSRRSYYEFLKLAWNILEPQTPFVDNWHIKYLCDLLQSEVTRIARGEHKTQDIIINIPPRSMKSGIVTIYLNAWAWLWFPHVKFITASYSQDLSTEHSIKTRRLIESEWYAGILDKSFSMTTDQNIKSKFENSKSGYRYATSVGGALTGSGADIFIADDPHKAGEVKSEVSRKNVTDWWDNTVFSRLNDQEVGLKIIVMQRLHEDDLTGHALGIGGYKHINIPAQLTADASPELVEYYDDGLFFPKRFSKRVLESAKGSMGSREFAGQYLQQPSPDDGDIINVNWFGSFKVSELPDNITRHYYTDSAYGKEDSDNSATICYSKYKNNLYIWGVYAWNLKFPEFIKRYVNTLEQSGYKGDTKCYFEPKASGISMIQQLKSILNANIIEDKAPVESKVTRVSSASASIEAGRVFIHEGCPGKDILFNEARMFPNGKNDDTIDALASVVRIELAKNGGILIGMF